jgi:hypothetical protein
MNVFITSFFLLFNAIAGVNPFYYQKNRNNTHSLMIEVEGRRLYATPYYLKSSGLNKDPIIQKQFKEATGVRLKDVLKTLPFRRPILKESIEQIRPIDLINQANNDLERGLTQVVQCGSTSSLGIHFTQLGRDEFGDRTIICDKKLSPSSAINTSVADLREYSIRSLDECKRCGNPLTGRLSHDPIDPRTGEPPGSTRTGTQRGDDWLRRVAPNLRDDARRRPWAYQPNYFNPPPQYMRELSPGTRLPYGDESYFGKGEKYKSINDKIRIKKPVHDEFPARNMARYISANIMATAADFDYAEGDKETVDTLLDIADSIADFALNATPIVGEALSMYQAIAGVDLCGNPLSDTERVLAGLGAIPIFGGAARLAKGGKALGSIARKLASKFPKVFRRGEEIIERGSDLARRVERWNPCDGLAITSSPCNIRDTFRLPMEHIVNGHFTPTGKIIGGLHTPEAMTNFFKRRPDIFKEAVQIPNPVKNGVTRWKLPARAFKSAPRDRAKTLFPPSWTPEKIAKSVNSIIGDTPIRDLPQPLIREVDKVWIDIRIDKRTGRIGTVFPAWPQRAPK